MPVDKFAGSTGLPLWFRTGVVSHHDRMPTFEVVLKDRSVELVDGADAYQQEGPMTTFFRLGDGRSAVDCWSVRMASFRTADLVMVRRHEAGAAALRLVADHA
jgi:hypothetical protein